MTKKLKAKSIPAAAIAQVTHGVDWLSQMTEPTFRDEVLKDLFTNMKKHGGISDFMYLHGRNEHGIDWIVIERGPLSDRYVGIQAKSKAITKQGDSRSDSALAIKHQCESAYDHRFNWSGNNIRVDNVELWMSAHITADATEEFIAPASRHKIGVKKADVIFTLIEKYCKHLLSRIPGLAESGYVHKMSHPDPLPIRILGIQLNPKKHFLEPKFSKHSEYSLGRVFDKRRQRMGEEEAVYVDGIISDSGDSIVIGPELSGKTYLTKRLSVLLAEQGMLPVSVEGAVLASGDYKTIYHFLASQLTWYSLSSLKDETLLPRQIVVLIDNADALSDDQLQQLRSTAHKKIRFLAFARRSRTVGGYTTYFISGVKAGAVHGFIRSLDIEANIATALTDRASQFIQRTIGTSGLPANPFTVSVMLQECQVAKRRLATPTMGRLIERFVEGQIGSHSEHMRADFETKAAFLTALGGTRQAVFTCIAFRKRLARFLATHGHAHDIVDFEQDLLDSGLLDRDAVATTVRWTHPVFLEFFWVRNLVREKRYDILGRYLLKSGTSRVAAIIGSQMGNVHPVLAPLLTELSQKSWMNGAAQRKRASSTEDIKGLLPGDSEEDALLKHIEDTASGAKSEVSSKKPPESLPAKHDKAFGTPDSVSQKLSIYAERVVEEKHYLAINIGALLVNSRGLTREDKEQAIRCVVRSTMRMGKHFSDVLDSVSTHQISPLMVEVFATYWCLVIVDSLIGDAFLTEVFRGIARNAESNFEKLLLTDILVACGSADPSSYVELLKCDARVSDAVAVYLRLVSTYYFRFHKSEDKAVLREALKSVRKLAKGFSLPPIA